MSDSGQQADYCAHGRTPESCCPCLRYQADRLRAALQTADLALEAAAWLLFRESAEFAAVQKARRQILEVLGD